MNETNSLKQSAPIHDELFYWENIVFLVENTLFKAPRYHFENFSEVFKTMFTLPHRDGVGVDGSSDEYPLVLQDITAQEFRSLLNVMLHLELPLLTNEAWLDVLKLSNMWRLVNIRNIAIRELSNRDDMSFVDNIVWGRCYKVAAWVIKGYSGLIDRGEVVSLEEAVRIGIQATLNIWRSQSLFGRYSGRSYRPGGSSNAVLDVFEEEIREVRREQAEYGPEELVPTRPSSPGKPSDPQWF
ncbi:hypothetical protein IW261DRAFT_1559736 [Armillaria novae-zelandiae]|uniref:BTB domain-containing protein n=1 Tax=Armillaria novae-zelandiae TaxID=153914 RepID=A0AA39PLB6_9AGAR|nr:hypothetical protein IW261DRAFT_1559736 [Armillaria novae-zelandiae]